MDIEAAVESEDPLDMITSIWLWVVDGCCRHTVVAAVKIEDNELKIMGISSDNADQ